MRPRKVLIFLTALLAVFIAGCTVPSPQAPDILLSPSPTFATQVPHVDTTLGLQEGNPNPQMKLRTFPSSLLEDNRMGDGWVLAQGILHEFDLTTTTDNGLKWTRVTIDWGDWAEVQGEYSSFFVDPGQDQAITELVENGVKVVYTLNFWDELASIDEDGYSRFQTEEEILRYLDYAEFIVTHFKDRIDAYEIINEPESPFPGQYVDPKDYINLVERVIPIIRQAHPEARVVMGASSDLNYMFEVVDSDVVSMVDAISWHPMYGTSPEFQRDYYYEYPSIVEDLKALASAHGFQGEYIAEELNWRTTADSVSHEYSSYSEIVSAKYYARGIVMHLGMDIIVGLTSTSHQLELPKMRVIRNLSTIMAGASVESIAFKVQTEEQNLRSYTFGLSNGLQMIAIWTDGVALEDDPGVPITLSITDMTAEEVVAIDVLEGYEQQLTSSNENGNLVIQNILIKDYPIMIRYEPIQALQSISP